MKEFVETKVILFDLGRVLMHIDFEAFPRGLGLTTDAMKNEFNHTAVTTSVRRYETGMLSTAQFLDEIHELLLRRFPREQILEAFNGIIVSDNDAIIPFVNEMKRSYRIAILSNTCACHWEKVERISSILSLFPKENIFTSFEVRLMKPERKIYETVCSSLVVRTKEVVFIDDLAENIQGAIDSGMHGIIFRNAEQLKDDFYNLIRQKST